MNGEDYYSNSYLEQKIEGTFFRSRTVFGNLKLITIYRYLPEQAISKVDTPLSFTWSILTSS
jgi:hypothetical protein